MGLQKLPVVFEGVVAGAYGRMVVEDDVIGGASGEVINQIGSWAEKEGGTRD